MKRVSPKLRVAAALTAISMSAFACAHADDAPGLEVGALAPDFSLTGHDGKTYQLSELRKDQRVALVFHRSADW